MSDAASGGASDLQDAYAAIAELWCSPRDVDLPAAGTRARAAVAALDGACAGADAALARFLASPLAEQQYVQCFELDPQCPLYIGSHVFDEPKTCAEAGVSDRNAYMIDLIGIYRHFSLVPEQGELPDYLPLVVEFLGLTAESDDPPRRKLIEDYLLPVLPGLRARLQELEVPHRHLLAALESLLARDLKRSSEATVEASHD